MAINFPIPKNFNDIKNMDTVHKFIWFLIVGFIIFIIYKLTSKITQFSGFSNVDITAFQNKYKTRIDEAKKIINPTQQQKVIGEILRDLTSEEVISITALSSDLKNLPEGTSSKPIMILYDNLQSSTHDIIKNQIVNFGLTSWPTIYI